MQTSSDNTNRLRGKPGGLHYRPGRCPLQHLVREFFFDRASMRFRKPEIFLGVFLTVAVFALGMTLSSSPNQMTLPTAGIDLQRAVVAFLAISTILLATAAIGGKRFFARIFTGLDCASPLLTAVATAILAWLAYWQWDTLEKTDQSNRQINRAFVAGKTINISRDMPMYWQFTTGNTRAQNVEVHVYYDFSGDVNDRDTEKRTRPLFTPRADPEELLRANVDSEFARFDRIPLNLKSEIPIPGMGLISKQVDEMAERRADGYISGVITYDDVFKVSKRHISKFCFVIQPVKRGPEPTAISGGLCQFWNCVDEVECEYHKQRYEEEVRAIAATRSQRNP